MRLSRRFEALHLPLAPSRWLVRILRPVVQSFVPAVLDTGEKILLGSGIAGELIGDHHPRGSAPPLKQLAQEPLCGCRIPLALDQDIEHDAVLVDGAPQPVPVPSD